MSHKLRWKMFFDQRRFILTSPSCKSLQFGVPNPKIQTTTVSFPINENPDKIFITSIREHGFVINRTIKVFGPIICFPKHLLHWNVTDIASVNEESLCLFSVLHPKPDVFVLGTGDSREHFDGQCKSDDNHLNCTIVKVRAFMNRIGIACEIVPTEKAVEAFNILNSEYRVPIAAFLPIQTIRDGKMKDSMFPVHFDKPLKLTTMNDLRKLNDKQKKLIDKMSKLHDDCTDVHN